MRGQKKFGTADLSVASRHLSLARREKEMQFLFSPPEFSSEVMFIVINYSSIMLFYIFEMINLLLYNKLSYMHIAFY